MAFERQPSCQDSRESTELMPVAQARELMQQRLKVVAETEIVELSQALGRVLAEDVISPIDVPSHTNAAMDGFAVRSADLPSAGDTARLKLVGESWAGRPWAGEVQPGELVKIATGAVMPLGADTVVIVEHTLQEGDFVLLGDDTQPGRNVRHAGEDLHVGESVLAAGTWLSPAEIGQLASLGFAQVCIRRQLKVAVFSTGDELVSLAKHGNQELEPGQVFDSNRYTLCAMLERLGVEVVDLGVIADTPEATRAIFEKAAASADAVVSSGGASVSDADHVSRTLGELGDVTFWRLAMRPGRPLACGQVGEALFFGLPGNPVAVMVTFYQFVQPALRHMMGANVAEPLLFKARCKTPLRKTPGRVEFQRGILAPDADGAMMVHTTGKQGAGRISSMTRANCFIVLPPDLSTVSEGDLVDVQPFEGLV